MERKLEKLSDNQRRFSQKEIRIRRCQQAMELVIEFGGEDFDLGWVEELWPSWVC